MIERTLPDFKFIADNTEDRQHLALLLRELYDKGYAAGYLDARDDCVKWWKPFDDDETIIKE